MSQSTSADQLRTALVHHFLKRFLPRAGQLHGALERIASIACRGSARAAAARVVQDNLGDAALARADIALEAADNRAGG